MLNSENGIIYYSNEITAIPEGAVIWHSLNAVREKKRRQKDWKKKL